MLMVVLVLWVGALSVSFVAFVALVAVQHVARVVRPAAAPIAVRAEKARPRSEPLAG